MMRHEAHAEEQQHVVRADAQVIRRLDEVAEDDEEQERKSDEAHDHTRDGQERPPLAAAGDAHAEYDRNERQDARQQDRENACNEEGEEERHRGVSEASCGNRTHSDE